MTFPKYGYFIGRKSYVGVWNSSKREFVLQPKVAYDTFITKYPVHGTISLIMSALDERVPEYKFTVPVIVPRFSVLWKYQFYTRTTQQIRTYCNQVVISADNLKLIKDTVAMDHMNLDKRMPWLELPNPSVIHKVTGRDWPHDVMKHRIRYFSGDMSIKGYSTETLMDVALDGFDHCVLNRETKLAAKPFDVSDAVCFRTWPTNCTKPPKGYNEDPLFIP